MKLHVAAILVIFWLGVFTAHMVKGSAGSQTMRKISCVNLSAQQRRIQTLVSYEKQNAPVKAIMFINNKGVKICVSPDLKWVQDAITKIDQRRTAKRK